MTRNPADEPPIDTSLFHYKEERALAIALEKATTPEERAKVEHLIELRRVLMQRRESFHKEATAKRHARGEIYSKAMVAAINTMAGTKDKDDESLRSYYEPLADTDAVLKFYALTHFGFGLVSARLELPLHTPDIADAARDMHAHEEAFAAAWMDAIGDPAFASKLRQEQRKALAVLRTSKQRMYLETSPVSIDFDDEDATTLGKAWKKLDDLARELGAEPLSQFISIADADDCMDASVSRILATVDALSAAVQAPGNKFPSKRAVVAVLARIRATLEQVTDPEGGAYFDIDL